MFVLEESQLLEDTIKDKAVLELYKTLKKHESSSSREGLLDNLNSDIVRKISYVILDLSINHDEKKLSFDERDALLNKLELTKDDAAALLLIVAATCTQLFVIDNFTGPRCQGLLIELERSEVYEKLNKKFTFQSLSTDGCEAYHLIANPWLLKVAHLSWYLLNNLGTSKKLLELEFLVWKHRFITIYLLILHEQPETLLKDLKKIQEFIFDHHVINDLKENKTQLVRFNTVELCCELIQSALIRDGITSGRKIFDYASELSGITIEHTGVLGRRTRFQQSDIPQLVVKVFKEKQAEQQQPIAHGDKFQPNLDELPKDIELDDDTLLPDILFVSDEGEASCPKDFGVEAQLLMLTRLDYILKSEVMEESLKDEWTLAYLRSIIKSATVWAVKYKALAHRSVVEKKQMRKMDRALLQLEELIKEVEQDGTNTSDLLRMKSFYSVLPLSKWQMQRSLGDISYELCLYKNALEVYTRIEYWEGIIKCHSVLGESTKAEILIRQELAKQETPYLYCLLGDVTDDIQYYEKSWSLSNGRFARAKKSVGTYYYVRKRYSEAIDNYELALSASPSNVSILSILAYSCLLLERYERAADCYRNLTYQDDTNFLAWNNLSKAYIKLNQKERAWRTFREAIKCNYEEPKIWENFMLVSIEIGALDDVITAWQRLIDIKGSHTDDQILSALTYSLIKKSYGKVDIEFNKLCNEAVKLVARISATTACSSRVWVCYLRLLVRQFELIESSKIGDSQQEMTALDIDIRVGKIKNCLQRATPTTVVTDSNWHQSPEKINQILEAFDDVVDCYDLAFKKLGRRQEIWLQWKSFKMSISNTMKILRRKGYGDSLT